MKAWRVDLNSYDFVYLLAETRSKAKSIAMHTHPGMIASEFDWREIKAKRVTELDGDRITPQQLCERGLMWTECYGCGARISETATPTKHHDQWERNPDSDPDDVATWLRPVEGHDPRYLALEDVTPYWPNPYDGWCCKACYDDHPHLQGGTQHVDEPIHLSTEY